MQTNKGQPLAQTMPCSRFDDARIASGEAWRFRDLRPKAATDIGNVRDAQEFLGHSSETTTAGIICGEVIEMALGGISWESAGARGNAGTHADLASPYTIEHFARALSSFARELTQ